TRIKGERGENIENAISAYQQALTIYTQQDFPYEWAMTQNNLGITYRERIKGKRGENIENAIFAYQQALIIRTQTDFPQNWAATQNNLAAAYSTSIKGERAENIENAIFACQQALIIRTQTDFPQDWAETQNNLAAAYSIRIKGERAENIENAICAYQQALIIRTQKDFPVDCLLTANNLGTLHFNEGNWKSAIEAYITAIEAIEQSREWASNDYNKQEIISNAISVYQNIVQACINSGELDKALEFVERGKARNLVDLLATRDLYPKGDIPQKIIDQLDDLRQKVIAEEKRLKQQSNYKGGLDTNTSTEGNRDVAAAKASQNAALDRTHLNNLYHELEQLVTDKIQKIDPGFQLTQRVKPIEFEQIQATLPNQQTALIEWFISQKNFSVFIVTTQQAKPLHIAYSNEDYQQVFSYFDLYLFNYSIYKYLNQKWINLRSLCKQFYTPFNLQQFIASTEIFKFLLITCYQLLLNKNLWKNSLSDLFSQIAQNLQLETITEQIKQTLPDCNQVIIVPHRWLHLLPIHAIPLSNGKCLLDLFSNGVSYAPSVQLLELTQKQARKKKGNREDENFFAVQNPTQDLEFTEIEVQAIRKQFSPQDDVLEGIQAHKQALTKDRLSKANLSHFSCHGSFNFENPELSALHLASSKIEEKTKQDLVATVEKTRFLPDRDGSFIDLEQCLTLGEIFGLDLRNCRLVTLSACETGLTDFKSLSDEYIGLPSGFLFAGSPSVVSSLWAVNDLSTSLLMIKFYQNLEEINSVPIALNQAQLWLRSVTKEELYQFANNLSIPKYQIIPYLDADLKELPADTIPFASPYYWAAFCAIGS
ncbi:MAG: CHAT domain-containing tetratricopeptide repeat protein, partial [Cyanobacteria bacterium P01_A01_bin.84]